MEKLIQELCSMMNRLVKYAPTKLKDGDEVFDWMYNKFPNFREKVDQYNKLAN